MDRRNFLGSLLRGAAALSVGLYAGGKNPLEPLLRTRTQVFLPRNPLGRLRSEQTRALNAELFDRLASWDPEALQPAIDAVNDFTRTKMKEDGFYRRILPPVSIDRVTLTEAEAQAAAMGPITIPGVRRLPQDVSIKGPRYEVKFDRIMTPRFTKDVEPLTQWKQDLIRETDESNLAAIRDAMPYTGEATPGSINRRSLCDALAVLRS
jgi:hypothetical protein